MNINKQLELDLKEVKTSFPKLSYFKNDGERYLKGDLDICDNIGVYWDTFEVGIVIPDKYPYSVPHLFELSKKIPREEKRHVSVDGLCCVDIDHELLYLASRGLMLVDFIRDKVYPFFSNQLYYDEEKEYAKGEYKHRFDGVRQFYERRLNLVDTNVTITFLECLINNNLPGRNEQCLCLNGKKYKHCHEVSIDFLKSVGIERAKLDLTEFRKL